jgi:hypothetical protein
MLTLLFLESSPYVLARVKAADRLFSSRNRRWERQAGTSTGAGRFRRWSAL